MTFRSGFTMPPSRRPSRACALPLVWWLPWVSPAAILQDHTLSWDAAGLSTQGATFHPDAMPPALFDAVKHAVSLIQRSSQGQTFEFKYGKGVTWWMPLGAQPRSAIELAIHHFHRLGGFDRQGASRPPVVGAEWWIQDREATEGISYHYDKDEAYASNHMTMRFPEVATVTYLSGSGGPTFVLNQTTPDGNAEVPELPENGWLSFPQPNKHLLFRGNLQHGVPAQLATGLRGTRD